MSFMALDRINTYRGNQPFFIQNNPEGSDIQISQLPRVLFLQNQVFNLTNDNYDNYDNYDYIILIVFPLLIYYLYRLLNSKD